MKHWKQKLQLQYKAKHYKNKQTQLIITQSFNLKAKGENAGKISYGIWL